MCGKKKWSIGLCCSLCLAVAAEVAEAQHADPVDLRLVQAVSVPEVYEGYAPVLVGDLDGDGRPEWVTVAVDYRDNGGCFVVLPGGKPNPMAKVCFGAEFGTPHTSMGYAAGPLALAQVKDGAGQPVGLVYVVCGTAEAKVLQAYRYLSPGALVLWREVPLQHNFYGNPGIADLNADGRPEVYVGCEVFDAWSLQGLGVGEENIGQHLQHDGAMFMQAIAADVYPERPGLELVCGNQIYGLEPDGLHLLQTVGARHDGSSLTADLDGDGRLEILVRNTRGLLSVYSPQKGAWMVDGCSMEAHPVAGDIDGDGLPEIVGLKSKSRLVAYKYQPKTHRLREFWSLRHTDISGQTGLILFDFNGDGRQEIVYRDETSLRIINGSGKSLATGQDTLVSGAYIAYALASFPVASKTKSEYPVVADVDGDGQTEIIVPGALYGRDLKTGTTINVFKANRYPWQPALPYWTQYTFTPKLIFWKK